MHALTISYYLCTLLSMHRYMGYIYMLRICCYVLSYVLLVCCYVLGYVLLCATYVLLYVGYIPGYAIPHIQVYTLLLGLGAGLISPTLEPLVLAGTCARLVLRGILAPTIGHGNVPSPRS